MESLETHGAPIPGLDVSQMKGWLIVIEGTDGVGRSTQTELLRGHLQRKGYAVAETGLSRSDLASAGIRRAKQGNTLGPDAFNLFYATDFADRLERQIIPALQAGFVMLTDRYIYSLIARAIVRGADPDWIQNVYEFALKPHAVFYLRLEVDELVQRNVLQRGFDYWESGMDLRRGHDLFDSFVDYQQRIVVELDRLAGQYDFDTVDATRPPGEIAEYLAGRVMTLLERSHPPLPDLWATR